MGTSSLGQFSCSTSHNPIIDCSPGQSLSPSSQGDQPSPNMSNISNVSSPCLSMSFSRLGGVGCESKFAKENSNNPSTANVSSQCLCSQNIYDLYTDLGKVVAVLVKAREDHIKHLLPNKSEEELQKMAAEHFVCSV